MKAIVTNWRYRDVIYGKITGYDIDAWIIGSEEIECKNVTPKQAKHIIRIAEEYAAKVTWVEQ